MNFTFRRKSRRFGIWVSADSVNVDSAGSFYAVDTSAPRNAVISGIEDLGHDISTPRAIRSVGATIAGSEGITEALIRIRTGHDLYQSRIATIKFDQQTLFSTSMHLPANLHEGDYRARFFLTRTGQVVDMFETAIDVQKVGLERFLFRLSRESRLIYVIVSLAIAIMAGWGASAAFRVFRT